MLVLWHWASIPNDWASAGITGCAPAILGLA